MKYEHSLLIRILLCFIPLSLLTWILTPITLKLSYITLLYYNPILISADVMVINGIPFSFIEACIATSAYYLIILLVLLTKEITLKQRIKLIFIGSLLILLMNLLRIFILIFVTVNYGFYWFEIIHLAFWKFVSGIYIALVWILLVRYYKIKSVPVYDDIKYLFNKSYFKKYFR